MDFFTSQCCKAEAIVRFSDFPDFVGGDPKKQGIGTASFICKKCKKPCDILPLEKTIVPDSKEDDDFKWSLIITRVDNGYLLEGRSESDMPMKLVKEDDDKDELKVHEQLLFAVMEYFSFQGSKHDLERLRIVREKKKKS